MIDDITICYGEHRYDPTKLEWEFYVHHARPWRVMSAHRFVDGCHAYWRGQIASVSKGDYLCYDGTIFACDVAHLRAAYRKLGVPKTPPKAVAVGIHESDNELHGPWHRVVIHGPTGMAAQLRRNHIAYGVYCESSGGPGDWLVRLGPGEESIVSAEEFAQRFRIVGEEE